MFFCLQVYLLVAIYFWNVPTGIHNDGRDLYNYVVVDAVASSGDIKTKRHLLQFSLSYQAGASNDESELEAAKWGRALPLDNREEAASSGGAESDYQAR